MKEKQWKMQHSKKCDFQKQIALSKCAQNQIPKSKIKIPRQNAVTKRPVFLRGITYLLLKWKESALADSSFMKIITIKSLTFALFCEILNVLSALFQIRF